MILNLFAKFTITILILATGLSASSAQTSVKCKDSFAPTFICDRYADLTSNFSLSNIIMLLLYIGIFAAIIFILFQIFKAVFAWLNKSSDDKARSGAIKSISNAVIGGVVLLVMLVIVIFGSDLLGIGGIPAPLYACYSNQSIADTTLIRNDIDLSTITIKNSLIHEISGVLAYEGKPSFQSDIHGGGLDSYNNTKPFLSILPNPGDITPSQFAALKDFYDYADVHLFCRDNNTGKEYNQGYLILKRVGVQK